MSFSGQIYPDDTIGYFRIASATGRQPIEPVGLGQFLLGSAPHCQLRLGDPGLPDVLTVLLVERDSVTLRAEVDTPSILVNGTPVMQCELRDGDLVEIGEHRLLFRLIAEDGRITLDETAFGTAADSLQTAEQLVDQLAAQLELVEELANTPERAVVDLLKSAARVVQSEPPPLAETPAETQTELQQVTALLQKHHEASRIRLQSLTEVLDHVVGQQKLIADALEVMSSRIQALDSGSGYQQHRASA